MRSIHASGSRNTHRLPIAFCTLVLLGSLPQAAKGQQSPAQLPKQQQGPSAAANSTTGPTPATSPVEDYVVYRFFFEHLENLDKGADYFEAEGKDGSEFRSYEQKAANLTELEGQVMKQVAFDCNRAVEQVMAKQKAMIDALRAQYPHTPIYKIPAVYHVPLPPELAEFDQQKKQIINDHINQLKSLIGDASFQKLDAYVKKRFHPRVVGKGESFPGRPVGIKVGDPITKPTELP